MPLPKPKKNQKQDEFIESCMSSETMKKEYPNNKQRLAICFSQYKRRKDKKQSKGSNEEPKWKDVEGDNSINLI